VDYSSPIATVSGLTYSPSALAHPGDYSFGHRAYDNVLLLEESNVDAVIRLILDASGVDITNRPAPPVGITIEQLAGAKLRVRWLNNKLAAGGKPTGFHVYKGTPTISYGSPAGTVNYADVRDFHFDLTGLTNGATYQVGVRAFNATAEEPNTTVASAVAVSTGPTAVDSLAVSATFVSP
jgi:hypothetical protein